MATLVDGATRIVLPHRFVDNSRQRMLIISYSVSVGLGISAVALRTYTRVKIIGKMGKDDWIMCIIGFIDIIYLTVTMLGTRYGMGLHVADWKPEWFEPAFKLLLPVQALYFLNFCLVKISILLFYLRLATTASIRGFKRIVYWTIGILSVFLVAGEIGTFCQCVPLSDYWNPSKPVSKKNCINTTAFFYSTSIFHIVTDLWLLALPSKLLFRVQRPLTQQLLLLGIFTIGIFSTICSCCRLYSILPFTQSDDPLWDAAPIKIWSCVELNLAIICACTPSFKAFFTTKSGRKNSDASCTTCGSLDPNVSVLVRTTCPQCLRRVSTVRSMSISQSSRREDGFMDQELQKGESNESGGMSGFREWGVAGAELDGNEHVEDDHRKYRRNSVSASIAFAELHRNSIDDIEAQRNTDHTAPIDRPRTSSMTMPDPEFLVTTFSSDSPDPRDTTRPAVTKPALHRTRSSIPMLRSRRAPGETRWPLQTLLSKTIRKGSSLVDVCHSISHASLCLKLFSKAPTSYFTTNSPKDLEMGLPNSPAISRSRIETRCTRGSIAVPPTCANFMGGEGLGSEGPSNMDRERQASRIFCRKDFRVESNDWEAISL